MTSRTVLKAVAERLLVAGGAGAVGRAVRRRDTIILGYHNVVPSGDGAAGETSLHIRERVFARQMDLLMETHDIVPLAVVAHTRPPSRRPQAVITFDDAYRGAVTAGIEVLRERKLPGTVFVAPAFLNGGSFWWDRLADRDTGLLSQQLRSHALSALGGRNDAVLAWAAREGLPQAVMPAYAEVASDAELRAAGNTPGISIGSHTWSHPSLPALSAAELTVELERSLHWLEGGLGGTLPWLAYPYGHASPAVTETAAKYYSGALSISGGWLRGSALGAERFLVPRLNVPASLSLDGFALRIAGVLS